jgi:ATP-dependent DNA ligase
MMLPRVQPIAPIRRPGPFDDPGWLFDLKYDGFRGICYLEQGRCRLISRNGNLMHGLVYEAVGFTRLVSASRLLPRRGAN